MDMNKDFFGFWQEEQEEPEWQLKEGERRDVAVLFADVHGFTNMSGRHDPEIVHAKIDELMKVFSKCTHYYGGFVDKYVGDCIMSLFGAKVASENDTERAILAGLKMINQLKLYNALLKTQPQFKDEELSIRVGINTGLVSVGKVGAAREGDFTVYGNTVNLASRMESNAPLNQIMVSAQTKQTVEHLFEFERVGYIQVKGFDEQIETFVVKCVRNEHPHRWSGRKTSYVGRRTEITLLHNIVSNSIKRIKEPETKSFSHTKISITGEAGIGKSRLLYETLTQQQDSFIYLCAMSSNVNPAPLNTLTSLLENYFHVHVNQPVEIKKQKLETGIAELINSMPLRKEALEDIVPILGYLLEIFSPDIRLQQKGKDLLIHIQHSILVFIEAIISLAELHRKPLVISWDDLHWADDVTLLTLDYLYKSAGLSNKNTPVPILSFILYREWDCKQAILDMIEFDQKVALTALKDSEIIQLIKQQAGQMELPQSTIDKVKELSDGNPFFLEEWCNYIYNLPKYEKRDLPVPTNLHALILSRLDRLSEAVKLLLQKASVIGQEFFVEILHEIEKRLQNSDDTDKTLADMEGQSLILKMLGFDYSAYFFKHITTREVAYQTLLQINRKVLHQLTAEAIESIYPERLDEFLFALAEHYQRAEVADKAQYYLFKAANAAARSFNNTQAINYYDHILTILPETDIRQKADTLLKKAEICWLTGQYNEAEQQISIALNLAEEINDRELCFEAYRQRGIARFYREELSQARQDFEQCLTLAESVIPEQAGIQSLQKAVAYGNLGIWFQHNRAYDNALEFHQQSLNYANLLTDSHRKAKTLNNLGLIYMEQNRYEEAIDHFRQCLSISEINRYLKEESLSLGNLGLTLQKQNKPDEAKQYFERKWLLCEKMGDQLELIKVLGNIGNLHRDKGEHREAMEYYSKVLRIKEMLGNPKELAISHKVIAMQLLELNLQSEALIEIDKAIDYAADYPNLMCGYLYTKAIILYELKDYKQATEFNQPALEMAKQQKKQQMIDACNELSEKIRHAEETLA